MKTPKTLLTASAITAFSLGLAFGQEQQREVGATERDTQTRTEIEQVETGAQEHQTEFGAQPGTRQQQTDRMGTTQQQTDRMGTAQQQTVRPGAAQQQEMRAHKASDLKGSRVQSSDGERLGTIDDLAVDLQTGEVSYLIVSAGGFLGIGGDLRPVPPESVQIRNVDSGIEVVLQISEDRWENAPTVERDQIAQLGQETQGRQIYQFYGADFDQRRQQTQFGAPARDRDIGLEGDRQDEFGSPVRDRDQDEHDRDRDDAPGAGAQSGQQDQQEFGAADRDDSGVTTQEYGATGRDHQTGAQALGEEPRGTQSDMRQDQQYGATARDRDTAVRPGQQQQQFGTTGEQRQPGQMTAQRGQTRLASDLMDKEVRNAQNEDLGKITDFLVNIRDGSIAFVLLEPDTGFWETADYPGAGRNLGPGRAPGSGERPGWDC